LQFSFCLPFFRIAIAIFVLPAILTMYFLHCCFACHFDKNRRLFYAFFHFSFFIFH